MKQNKNTTEILRSTLRIAMLLLALALASCADESLLPDRNGKDQTSLTLEILPPGGFSIPQTRAPAQMQDRIDQVVVLVYNKSGTLIQLFSRHNLVGSELEITLKSSKDENERFDIVVLGNPEPELDNYDYQNKTKAELQKDLSTPYDEAAGMMMWGEATDVLIHSISNTLQIKMLRALARIDIGCGVYTGSSEPSWGGLTNFKLFQVTVVNANNSYLPIPNAVDLNGKVIAVSVPQGAQKNMNIRSYKGLQNYITSLIVPETESPLTDPVKLIIEGRYNNSLTPSFYRVDMCLPNATTPGAYVGMDILRNHLYRITITKIVGVGYPSFEEAVRSPSLNNIVADIKTIAGWSGDIIFDAHSSIATDVSEVQVYGDPAGKSLFTVTAHFEQGATVRVTGPDSNVTLTSDVPLPIMGVADTPPGDYTYVIEVGKLKKEIKYRVQPAVDAHFDALPFKNVASITIKNPQAWISLSPNMVWKATEQQSVHLEGNGSEAYVHFDENLERNDAKPRVAEVLIQRNGQTFTRVHFDQSNIAGMICANFGGNFKVTNNGNDVSFEYEKNLAIESLEEHAFRIYDGDKYSSPTKPLEDGSLPFIKITAPIAGIRMGRFLDNFAGLGSGMDDKGSSTTFAHANAKEDGVSQFGLTIYNNYPSRYCYDKNRDEDGNGTIDENEVKWYVPTRAQLASLYLLRSTLATKFPPIETMEPAYWSIYVENSSSKVKKLGVMDLSNGVIGLDSRYRPIRCVRDISK